MSQLNITCPHCNFSKSIDRQRIPVGIKSIKCPKCQKTFALDSIETNVSAQKETQGSQQPSPMPTPPPQIPQAQRLTNQASLAPAGDFKFCAHCGQRIHKTAESCPKCGVRAAAPANSINKVALLLITFFLGGIGGHKFYLRKYLLGVLYLLFFWTYIPTLVAFIEFILYARKRESDLQQKYPDAGGGAVVVAIIVPFFSIAIIGILAAIAIPQFAAYREKAHNAAASNDLKACKTTAEAYFARGNRYPTDADQLQCQSTKNVALYYLSLGPDKYRLISFHDKGKKAFITENSNAGIAQDTRESIEGQIAESYGPSALERTFHFIETPSLPEGTLQAGSLGNPKLQNDAMLGVAVKVATMGCKEIASFLPYVVQMPEGSAGSRNWREKWMVSGCDNTYPVDITFKEDGMGAVGWSIK